MSTCSVTQNLHYARVLLKRSKFAIAMLVCVIVTVALIAVLYDDHEPRYEGKKLSAWLTVYNTHRGEVEGDKAEQAVRAIGTNALPFLLDWMRYEPSPSKTKQFLDRALRILHLPAWRVPAEVRAERASAGFIALGTIATPAIPELTKLASAPNGKVAPWAAAFELGRFGPTALPALEEVIRNTNAVARYGAVLILTYEIERFGTNVIPILVDCLGDPDEEIVLSAGGGLGELRVEPAVVCVSMAQFFDHPDLMIRLRALGIVSKYGPRARVIVPELVEALVATEPIWRRDVESVLKRIAPEVLTNAPSR